MLWLVLFHSPKPRVQVKAHIHMIATITKQKVHQPRNFSKWRNCSENKASLTYCEAYMVHYVKWVCGKIVFALKWQEEKMSLVTGKIGKAHQVPNILFPWSTKYPPFFQTWSLRSGESSRLFSTWFLSQYMSQNAARRLTQALSGIFLFRSDRGDHTKTASR